MSWPAAPDRIHGTRAPRRAHTEFQWQLRGVLLELATIVTAAAAAIAAGVLTFRLLGSGTALVATPRGSAGPWVGDLQDFTRYGIAAMWLASCAIVMCWVPGPLSGKVTAEKAVRLSTGPNSVTSQDSA